jgi:hypothetical protein
MDLQKLKERWPSSIVSRSKVGEFSGGLLNPKSLANADSAGIGPAGRIRVGRLIAYDTDLLISWIESRSQVCK